MRLRDVEPGSVRATRELDEQRLVDLDEAGEPVGVELLGVSEGVSLEGLPHAGEIRKAMGRIGALASAG